MKLLFLIFLLTLPFPSYGNDYLFVLKCTYEDKKSSQHPFIFIGKKNGQESLIIYLKSDGKIFNYKGGESKNLKQTKESSEFYEYEFRQPDTPIFRKSIEYFSLDRSTLRLSEKRTILDEKGFPPTYAGYTCFRESNEKQTYIDSMNLKKKYDTGGYNKI